MTKNVPKASSMKKSSLNIKKTTSFKTSKKKGKSFTSGKKIKKTTSLKINPTESASEIPEFVEEVAAEQVEVPVGHLDEQIEIIVDDSELKVSGFFFGAPSTPEAPKDVKPEPEPEPVSPVEAEVEEEVSEVSMKNQNDEEIRPISIDFSTGPVIKKAVKITQSEMEPIKPEDFRRKPAPPVSTAKKEPSVKEAAKKPVEKIIVATEELPPITASDLETHLQEEVAALKERCKELEQEKIEVATSAKLEYKQLSGYLKKDIEGLKAENATITQQNSDLLEEIGLLESRTEKLDGSEEKVNAMKLELKVAKTNAKEVEKEFVEFIKLADSLFEKLPPAVIKEFLASEQCSFYKKALERLTK